MFYPEEVKASLAKLSQQIYAQDEKLAEAYTKLESNTELKELVDTLFNDYEDDPQAQYWISFMQMLMVRTQYIHAIRTRNCSEFKTPLKPMLPWMLVYNNDRYGQYLPDFTTVFDTLSIDHAAFIKCGVFAQLITG